MRKHLLVTLTLLAGAPMCGYLSAHAEEAPQTQSQAARTITGSVLDENNEPVIGATVSVKGQSGVAVNTNFDGNFTIKVVPGATLNVSYVGYKPASAKAADGMTIYLQSSTEQLDQLVVVGYGTQKKANLTGAVATVDVARVMDSRPVQDVAKALQGAVPGLTITNANGDISSNPTISIRGTGTLSNNANSAPLIVVDGVPVDDMSYLNPDDIQEISVLKDASSSAIYGSRASFGVILITTKQASVQDKVSVKYSGNFGWGTATRLPEYNTTVDNLLVALDNTNPGRDEEIFGMYYDELLPLAQAWRQQHGGKQYTSLVELQKFQGWDNVGDYYTLDPANKTYPLGNPNWDYSKPFRSGEWLSYADWDVAKTLFGTAFQQKHNVSFEGRAGKTNYRVSFGYDSREGLWNYNPEKMQRYMASANVETQLFKFLKAGARFNFSQRKFTAPHESGRSAYQYVWRFPAQFENYGYIRDAEGNPMGFRNEITYRMNGYNGETENARTRMQAYMIVDIIPGLQLQADYTYSITDMDSDAARIPFTMYSQWSSGKTEPAVWTNYVQGDTYAAQSQSRDRMWAANIFGTYTRTFANAHNLKVMLGWSAEQETYRYFYAQRSGLINYALPNLNLTNGDNYTVNAKHTHRATTGFFGRINYDYKGIYLFEANGRYDGSSRFPANDQWAFFPSFSAGYRFSEEPYFQPVKETGILTNGKIRASYGHIGNEAVGTNMFLSTATQTDPQSVHWLNGNQKITEYSMPTVVSSTLTWERIITTDVGVDFGFFNNSLNLGFDWFQRDTHDMIGLSGDAPGVVGTSAPVSNSGRLRTRGWELSIGWNHSFGDAQVYATFNIGDAKSKITRWNNSTGTIYSYNGYNIADGLRNYTEGATFGDIWGFETDGYYEMDDFTWNAEKGLYVPNNGVVDQTALESGTFHFGPGDIKFKDLNGDGVINNGDPNMKDENGNPIAVGTMRNHGDLKVIGNAMPRYEYSFHLGGAWKGFDLDLFFQGVGKRDMWATGSTIIPMSQSGYGTFTNQLSYNKVTYGSDGQITDYEINQGNDYPRMFSGASGAGRFSNLGRGCYNFYPQSRYLVSMAYLRLKNVTVGYTLPANITRKALIQRARVYFSADNLCFLHNGAGKYQLDPEMATSAGSSVIGNDGGNATFGRTVPMQRVLSVGVQVTF